MKKFLHIYIVFLAFTYSILIQLGSGLVLTFFHFLSVGLIVYYFSNDFTLRHVRKQDLSIYLIIGIVLFSSILNLDSISLGSTFHSLFYCFTFLALSNYYNVITEELMVRANKIIIYSYFANFILTYVLFYAGALVAPLDNFMMYYISRHGSLRPAGFSSEPSYTAIILTISFLVITFYRHLISNKTYLYIFTVYLIEIFLLRSSYGFLCLLIVAAYIFRKNLKRIIPVLIPLIFILFLVMTSDAVINNYYVSRILSLFDLMINGMHDIEPALDVLNQVDSSSYYRVAPSFYYLHNIDFFDFKTWFGYGLSNEGSYFASLYSQKGIFYESIPAPYFPSFFYSCGIIGALLFLYIVVVKYFDGIPLLFKFITVIILFNSNFSTQLLWFFIIQFSWLSYKIKERKDKAIIGILS